MNTRIIASTNQNLPELIRAGKFREDFYYRLNVLPITMPPLWLPVFVIMDVLQNFLKIPETGRNNFHETTPHRLQHFALTTFLQNDSVCNTIHRLTTVHEKKNMKDRKKKAIDNLRPEYNFDYSKAVRGKYYKRLIDEGSNVVILDPDIAKAF